MAEQSTAEPPKGITTKRLEQIASDACQTAIGSVDLYEHSKTEEWNATIINSILKSLISETTPKDAAAPPYKYAVNSTIIQHYITHTPRSKAKEEIKDEIHDDDAASKPSSDEKPKVSRRGMHSATGAYWNGTTDGMWSFKYEGKDKGLDIVVCVLWIAL